MDKVTLNKILLESQISQSPNEDLGLVITIPSFNEPDLHRSLESLENCLLPNCSVEVIVVLNASENVDNDVLELHQKTLKSCKSRFKSKGQLSYHFLMYDDLPSKWSGVGVARKIAMNEASRRLKEVNNDRGVIACFDADSDCAENYFSTIVDHFENNQKTDSVSIKYQHPLSGNEDREVYNAIIQYELHLRYYTDIQKWLGLPYAFQTVGSSMAVRAYAYDVIGGMNKRKAGEDFYFLQKFIQRGHHTEINETMIIPSPRRSDRVPFGTGRAVGEMLDNQTELTTYALQSFLDLKILLDIVPKFYGKTEEEIMFLLSLIPSGVQEFLAKIKGSESIIKLSTSTTNIDNFVRRFYNWFDAFVLMKYVHYMRDVFYENAPIEVASKAFLKQCTSIEFDYNIDLKSILAMYRNIDDKGLLPNEFKSLINK